MVAGMIDLEDAGALSLWTTRKSKQELWHYEASADGEIIQTKTGFTSGICGCWRVLPWRSYYAFTAILHVPKSQWHVFQILVKTYWLTDTLLQRQNPKRRQPEFSKPIFLRLLPEIQLHSLPVRLLLPLHNVGQFLPQMLAPREHQHPFRLKERTSPENGLWEMTGYRLGLRWLAHLVRRPFLRNGDRCAAKCTVSLLKVIIWLLRLTPCNLTFSIASGTLNLRSGMLSTINTVSTTCINYWATANNADNSPCRYIMLPVSSLLLKVCLSPVTA